MTRSSICFVSCIAVFASILFSSCATNFIGSAHVDKQGCIDKCRDWGMQLVGMVAMGEYSDACVCKATNSTSLNVIDDDSLLSAASTAAGGAGVVMQTRRNARQAGH